MPGFKDLLRWGRKFARQHKRSTLHAVAPFVRKCGATAECHQCGTAVVVVELNNLYPRFDDMVSAERLSVRSELSAIEAKYNAEERRLSRERDTVIFVDGSPDKEALKRVDKAISEAYTARNTGLERARNRHSSTVRTLETGLQLLARDVANNDSEGPAPRGCERCGACVVCCPCMRCATCNKAVESTCTGCDRCTDCCRCVSCVGCSRRVRSPDTCSQCRKCGNCCRCVRCARCRGFMREDVAPCVDCLRCRACCQCHMVQFFRTEELVFHPPEKVNRNSGEPPVRDLLRAKRVKFDKNPSKRYVSVEIEVASARDGREVTKAVKKWSGSIVRDGSLPQGGFEINTAPASGDLFVDQIEEICGALKNGNAEVTEACGLHVHVDARDFSFYEVRRLVEVYAKIEPALFWLVPPRRRESRYCLPCGESYKKNIENGTIRPQKLKSQVLRTIYKTEDAKDIPSAKKGKYHDSRYAALNLHSWFHRGTIECRLMNGTVDPKEIVAWGMLWARIMDFTKEKTDKEVAALAAFSDGIYSDRALLDIAGFREPKGPNVVNVKDFILARLKKYGS